MTVTSWTAFILRKTRRRNRLPDSMLLRIMCAISRRVFDQYPLAVPLQIGGSISTRKTPANRTGLAGVIYSGDCHAQNIECTHDCDHRFIARSQPDRGQRGG